MTVPKRKRNIQLNFRVTAEELKQIEEKMGQLGVFNGKPICGRWLWTGMQLNSICRS